MFSPEIASLTETLRKFCASITKSDRPVFSMMAGAILDLLVHVERLQLRIAAIGRIGAELRTYTDGGDRVTGGRIAAICGHVAEAMGCEVSEIGK